MPTDRRDATLDLNVTVGGPARSRSAQATPGLAPIERVSLFEEIIQRLVEFIIEEGLKPGDRLPPERALSERLGVGRSTVREAVTALRAIGVVEPSQRGMMVGRGSTTVLTRPLSWGLLMNVRSGREVMDARQIIEVGLAGMAAERATDEDVEALERQIASMDKASDIDAFAESDLGFHLAVARAGHNFVLYHVIETLQHVIRSWIEGVAVTRAESRAEWVKEHVAVFEAIRDRRADEARAAMETHLSAAGSRLLDVLADDKPDDAT